MAVDVAAADEVLQESLLRAHRLLADAPGTEVLKLLEEADRDLKRRLVGVAKPGKDMRFTDAQAMAYSRQIDVVTRYVKKRMLGITHEKATAAISKSVQSTAREIAQLNKAFTGVATPLMLREAATMADVNTRTKSSLLGQQATSVDRYGDHMIGDFRKLMRRGMVSGVSQSQMVDALVGHGGPRGPKVSTKATVDAAGKVVRLREEAIPEGLFMRKRYWAERVVRTEVAHGQNEARLATIERSRQTDFPDMGKKILAMMDMRTAMDSIGVHGQVRPTDGLFQDGAGRQYLRPPARPNDRETIVPWRMSWDETPYSAPMPPSEVAQLQNAGNVGHSKQVAVRQAQAAYKAELTAKAARAMRNVHRMIGEHLGGKIGPAIAAQNVAGFQAAQASARAQAKAARAKAAEVRAAAQVRATARSQRVVTAQAAAAAAVAKRMASARAKATAYRAKQRARLKGKIVRQAEQEIAVIRAKVASGTPGPNLGSSVSHTLQQLAVKNPETFGEIFQLTVKGGKPLAPKFFQTLAKTYKGHSRKIAAHLGAVPKPAAVPKAPKAPKVEPPKRAADLDTMPVLKDSSVRTMVRGVARALGAQRPNLKTARKRLRTLMRKDLGMTAMYPDSRISAKIVNMSASGTHNTFTGELRVTASVARTSKGVLRRVTEQEGYDVVIVRHDQGAAHHGLGTLVHEEIHAHTRWSTKGTARNSMSRVVEEVTTEVLARRLTRDVLKIPLAQAEGHLVGVTRDVVSTQGRVMRTASFTAEGPYGIQIQKVMGSVQKHTGRGAFEVLADVETAAWRMRTNRVATAETPPAHVRNFTSQLPNATAAQQEAIAKDLFKLRIQ